MKMSKKNYQNDFASLLFYHSHDPIMICDEQGKILNVNPAFENFTGYTHREIINQSTKILKSGEHIISFYQKMWESINTNGFWEGEIIDRHKNGTFFTKWLSIQAVRWDNEPNNYIAIFSDMPKIEEAKEKIWHQANFDALTDLPNRNMFLRHLGQEIEVINRNGLKMGLMYLDLDNFKEVNDSLGHHYGDLLLQHASKRIKDCTRKSDLVCRLGGDEFAIILSDIDDIHKVESVTRKLLQELSQPFILKDDMSVYISVSIGISIAPDDSIIPHVLLKYADQAMYVAKKRGKNSFHYFTTSMQHEADQRFQLLKEIHAAIEEQQFVLYYQPIIDLVTGEIHKAEALLRWQHPSGKLIGPMEFIPICEETGMIIGIGEWVMHEAILQVQKWRDNFDRDFQISVNKSPVQFRNCGPASALLLDFSKNAHFSPESIVVEITESVLLEDSQKVTDRLDTLKKRGVAISLDDFGTGYSSLSYLKKYAFDYLKIDQSFVRHLEINENDKMLCKTIVLLAHQFNIKVIAEGVETPYQRKFLEGIGCDYMQGYLVSKAIPAEEFEKKFFLR